MLPALDPFGLITAAGDVATATKTRSCVWRRAICGHARLLIFTRVRPVESAACKMKFRSGTPSAGTGRRRP